MPASTLAGSCIEEGFTECCDPVVHGQPCYTPTFCLCEPSCYEHNDCCDDISEICVPGEWIDQSYTARIELLWNFVGSRFATWSEIYHCLGENYALCLVCIRYLLNERYNHVADSSKACSYIIYLEEELNFKHYIRYSENKLVFNFNCYLMHPRRK